MDQKIEQVYENFLNPELVRKRLIAVSIYIAAFEMLKEAIVDRVRGVVCFDSGKPGENTEAKYRSEVLSRNRSPHHACLDWLKESEAIQESDVSAYDRVKACRNVLAHDATFGTNGLPPDFQQCFGDIVALLRKIELWWITGVEIPANPDFDGMDIDENEVTPGRVMVLQMLTDIALGSEEESRRYHDEFRKHTERV